MKDILISYPSLKVIFDDNTYSNLSNWLFSHSNDNNLRLEIVKRLYGFRLDKDDSFQLSFLETNPL